jgi:hypothetical protein
MELVTLTALSSMGVVMDCEAARAVKPLPAVVTDVLARLVVVIPLRFYNAGGLRWRRSTPWI